MIPLELTCHVKSPNWAYALVFTSKLLIPCDNQIQEHEKKAQNSENFSPFFSSYFQTLYATKYEYLSIISFLQISMKVELAFSFPIKGLSGFHWNWIQFFCSLRKGAENEFKERGKKVSSSLIAIGASALNVPEKFLCKVSDSFWRI